MYPTGKLDREDTLIYSLGLGSTGHDYSIVNEPILQGPVSPPTPPSNTTRRRRQTIEYRCPDRGTDGYICHSLGIHAPIHVMTRVSFSRCTLQKFSLSWHKYFHLQAKEQLERSGSHHTVTIHYIVDRSLLAVHACVVLFSLSLTHLEVLEEKAIGE